VAAATFDITIEQGATWRRSFQWLTPGPDEDTPGEPYDLTGCTALMQIRPNYGSPTLLLEATEQDGIILGEDGQITISLDGSKTINVTGRKARYDLLVSFPGQPASDEDRVLEGVVTIKRAVSVRAEVAS